MDRARRTALSEALVASAVVTGAVTAASAFLPETMVATAVGFVFLGATWFLVWRRDDAAVERFGLALGGVVLPGALDARRALASTARALAWAVAFAAVTFVPFYVGWRLWFHARGAFAWVMPARDVASLLFGQIVIIALPEEAFYRGYLQTRLDDVWPPRFVVFGAPIGPSLLVTSAIFALGHLATVHAPARLAVFFPSLLFGWLRARTRGIGAPVFFHASCNVFSELLGRGFGVY